MNTNSDRENEYRKYQDRSTSSRITCGDMSMGLEYHNALPLFGENPERNRIQETPGSLDKLARKGKY